MMYRKLRSLDPRTGKCLDPYIRHTVMRALERHPTGIWILTSSEDAETYRIRENADEQLKRLVFWVWKELTRYHMVYAPYTCDSVYRGRRTRKQRRKF
jgi:hypothetical protein